jgi:hypothetical protein
VTPAEKVRAAAAWLRRAAANPAACAPDDHHGVPLIIRCGGEVLAAVTCTSDGRVVVVAWVSAAYPPLAETLAGWLDGLAPPAVQPATAGARPGVTHSAQ